MEDNNKMLIPGSIIIAGLIIAGVVYYVNRSPEESTDSTDTAGEISIRPVSDEDYIRGNPNAQLTIVEYSDLECPFCKQYHETMLRIIGEYGKDGRVAWVYRHFPLTNIHPKAPAEAEAAECVGELGGNDAFWEYLDAIFRVTPSNNGLDLALLPELAETVGVDRTDFEACVNDDRHEDGIREDFEEAVANGGQGTPYSIIVARTGQLLHINGAQSYEVLKQTIDSLLGE